MSSHRRQPHLNLSSTLEANLSLENETSDELETELSDEDAEELENQTGYTLEEIGEIQEAYRVGDTDKIAEIEKRHNEEETDRIITKITAQAPGYYTDLSKPEDTDNAINEAIEGFEESKVSDETKEEPVRVTSGFSLNVGGKVADTKTEQQPPATPTPTPKATGFRLNV